MLDINEIMSCKLSSIDEFYNSDNISKQVAYNTSKLIHKIHNDSTYKSTLLDEILVEYF